MKAIHNDELFASVIYYEKKKKVSPFYLFILSEQK